MTEIQPALATTVDIDASTAPEKLKPIALHIVCERDVGLFNLVLGVIPHVYWALSERRIPVVFYGDKNCYWTPNGYRGRNTVWEYYFEPVVPEYPVSRIPPHIVQSMADGPPFKKRTGVGYHIGESAFVSNNAAWHIEIDGERLRGPKSYRAPSRKIRVLASAIVRDYIRPRDYIVEKADAFFRQHLSGRYLIGVHIRGTDALVDTTRHVRQMGVNFRKYFKVLRRLRREHPDALIFVASDEQASVDRIMAAFDGVIAYDSIRHQGGEIAGRGPAGGIMPAYLTEDPDRTARNGEEAVIEYLLLCRSNYLVHNLASIPRMVVLTVPSLSDTNTDAPSFLRRVGIVLRRIGDISQRHLSAWPHRTKLVRDTIRGQPVGDWYRLLHELWRAKMAARRNADRL